MITLQSEIVAGEGYTGGTGFDILDLETAADIDISALAINADIERLEAGGLVSATAAQVNNFSSIQTGALTLTTGGAVALTGGAISTNTFNLNAAGNTFDLTGVTTNAYTVNGAAGVDVITGGEFGDTLNGGGAGDTLNGNGGNDTLFGDGGADVVRGGTGDDRMVITQQAEIVGGETL